MSKIPVPPQRTLSDKQMQSIGYLVKELLRASWRVGGHHENGDFIIGEPSYAEAFGVIRGACHLGYGSLDGRRGQNLRLLFDSWCDDVLIEFDVEAAKMRRDVEVRQIVSELRL